MSAPSSAVPEAVRRAVAGGRCWGLELEPTWRVLGLTVEPPGGGEPLQVLCSPVSVLLAVLTREDGGRPVLVTFREDQLPAVSQRLGGATIGAEPFGAPEPRPGTWGPRLSLEGRSSAADGTAATLLLDLREDDARLRLFARFDAAELRRPDGTLVAGGGGGSGGA